MASTLNSQKDKMQYDDADLIFDRFPDFIREYIYRHNWDSLRAVQLAAAKTLLFSDHHLLLTSGTASGKTEAAFFPIISDLWESKPQSIGVLYVAPLKSLINDQFNRMDELLEESGIRVTHWHGDVAESHKKKLLKTPSGILQITPESLESMLMNRSNDIVRLFYDLRYIVVDEIHTLTGSDRGNQIICQIERLSRLIGHEVRRVGLSATVGDPSLAAAWLRGNSTLPVDVPAFAEGKIRWRLGMEHFYIQNLKEKQANDLLAVQPSTEEPQNDALDQKKADDVPDTVESRKIDMPTSAESDAGYEFMYDCVTGHKSLVFSNSREETEYLTATFRQIAKRRGERDIFLIHHGNLSASIREEAEMKMKDEECQAVTCATVTMELGIDIGRLERVLQSQSPHSVSSFLQRLGRSGRRGQPPEMMMVFREENPLPNTPLPHLMPWELLRAIAIVQLYMEERFIEPPKLRKMPLSLLFHQTLSILAASGELSPKHLAEKVLSLPPFSNLEKDDYRALLVSMVQQDYLEMTEEKGLIVGLHGEQLINSFKFYAVFKDTEDYTVRCGSDEIGTITAPPPVGDRFALAGRVWEVEEVDISHKLIYVHGVDGKMEISWPGDYGEIHTKILERMKRVLYEDTIYPYLKDNARVRLENARHTARSTGMLQHSLVHLGGYSWCLFPWLGTRSFRTCRKLLKKYAQELGISGIEFEGCCFITFKMEIGDGSVFVARLAEIMGREEVEPMLLVEQSEIPVFDKYDDCIPIDLLRKAYATDRLQLNEVSARIKEWEKEWRRSDI